MITAIVLIAADVAVIPEVAERIAEIDGVTEVYSVTGDIDLIAMVRCASTRRWPTSSPTRSTRCPAY